MQQQNKQILLLLTPVRFYICIKITKVLQNVFVNIKRRVALGTEKRKQTFPTSSEFEISSFNQSLDKQK